MTLEDFLPKHPNGALGMLADSIAAVDVEQWHKECENIDKQLVA